MAEQSHPPTHNPYHFTATGRNWSLRAVICDQALLMRRKSLCLASTVPFRCSSASEWRGVCICFEVYWCV